MSLAAPGPLYLVKDGKPVSTIVYPDDPDCWTFDAAKWVCVYVRKSTGAHLRFVPESKNPGGTLISVGHTRLAANAGIEVTDLRWDGHRMVVKGEVLFLLGRHEKLVNGTGALGTNRAAIAFLERFCGVRWFLPTPDGELVPKSKDVSVPRDLDMSFSPSFAFCDGRWPYRSGRPASFAHYYRMSIRRGHNTAHTWPLWTPAAAYFSTHPEYFAVIGSKRSRGRHHCTTNPELKRVLLRAMRRELDAGCDMLRLGQEDGYQPCQCPECESTDNYRMGPYLWQGGAGKRYVYETLRQNPCERVLLLQKWLIDKCRESHPNRLIQLLVYWPTLWPSRLFDGFGDNVIADICMPMEPQVVQAWRGKVKALSAYVYWGDVTMPMGVDVHVTPRELSEAVRHLRDHGFIGIRQFLGDDNWGLQGPLIYMLGKLLGDPDLDHQALIEEYCLGVYGRAAGQTMLRFFDCLYARHEELLPPLSLRGSRRPDAPQLVGMSKTTSRPKPKFDSLADVYAALYPPDFTRDLDAILRQAEGQAEDERSKGWLRFTRDYFDFSRLLGGMMVAHREHKAGPSEESLGKVKRWVDDFEDLRARIVHYDDAYVARWFPRHDRFCVYLTSDGQGEDIYYSRWEDRKRIALRHGLRGTAMGYRIGHFYRVLDEPITLFGPSAAPTATKPASPLSVTVRRITTPPKIDGTVEDDEWQGAPVQSLFSLSSAKTESRTEIRLLHDRRHLYVAAHCREPRIDGLVVRETGRDGPVWSLDCLELMLNPDAKSRARRFHLIVAPAPNSLYDAQYEDASWTSETHYALQIDKLAKIWSIELSIPFASFGVDVPAPGSKWSANFGRERHAGQREKPELLIWSPTRTGGFSDLTGTLVFE